MISHLAFSQKCSLEHFVEHDSYQILIAQKCEYFVAYVFKTPVKGQGFALFGGLEFIDIKSINSHLVGR